MKHHKRRRPKQTAIHTQREQREWAAVTTDFQGCLIEFCPEGLSITDLPTEKKS